MKKIYHLGGWQRNWGDMLLQYSMMHHFQRETKEPLEWVPIDLKEPNPIDADLVNLINDEGDLLLVGGGGLIMKGDGFATESGWQFNISEENLLRLKTPLVIYAAGYNKFPDEDHLSQEAVRHLKLTQEKAAFFSVRNQGTCRALKSFGLTAPSVLPDPGMFCPSVPVQIPTIETKDFCIGLNLAGDRQENRFPQGCDELVAELNDTIEKLSQGIKNLKVIFIPHISKYDIRMFNDLKGSFTFPCESLHNLMPGLYPESFCRVPTFTGVYERMDFVYGMRGHSNILSFGLGVPHLPLGNHMKNEYFAEEIGMPVEGETLYEKTDHILKTWGAYNTALFVKREIFKEKFQRFNSLILNYLDGGYTDAE